MKTMRVNRLETSLVSSNLLSAAQPVFTDEDLPMLTYEECLAMAELDPQEIDAIAEHEHLDPMIAIALGHYLITHHGEAKIRRIILDDIEAARRGNNLQRVAVLNATLLAFMKQHPQARDVA